MGTGMRFFIFQGLPLEGTHDPYTLMEQAFELRLEQVYNHAV